MVRSGSFPFIPDIRRNRVAIERGRQGERSIGGELRRWHHFAAWHAGKVRVMHSTSSIPRAFSQEAASRQFETPLSEVSAAVPLLLGGA